MTFRSGSVLALGFVLAASPIADADDPVSPFTEEALQRGLIYTMVSYPQLQGFDGQGTGFVDLDSDGDPDVVVIGAADGRIGIFENLGGGTFVDRSVGSGIPTMNQQEGFAAADYDADGKIDLYLTQYLRSNLLMRNLGGFQFENVTATAGVGDLGPSAGASWGDYDGDGWLDLYVCTYSGFAPGDPPNRLYRNLGDGTFQDTGAALGVDSAALSFQSVWSDYDRDGDVDLYVSNDRGAAGWPPNQLWRNDGGVFTDVSASSGADVSLFSMGLAAGDFDGNLFPDYYVTDLTGDECPEEESGYLSCDGGPSVYEGANRLLINQADGTFLDLAGTAGVAVNLSGWGAIFFDYDNNGFKDLYVNNMWMPNSFFANDGTMPCVEIAAAAGVRASFDPSYDGDPPASIASYSSAVADVNGDGAIDLLVNNVGHRAELFINHEGAESNFVRYRVVGEYPNLDAVGASVETTAGGRTFFDEIYAGGNGYLGQNELVLHVGLDAETVVNEARVRWPGGAPTRLLSHLPANQTWTLYPPSRLCDAGGEGAVDLDDFHAFVACYDSGFAPGCEMFDFDGESTIDPYDLLPCFEAMGADCNGNGTADLLEILLGPSLDADDDGIIDCCPGATGSPPGAVGNSLLLTRAPTGEAELAWSPSSGASSYDVFRSTSGPDRDFAPYAGASTPTYVDPDTTGDAFYLVGARNDCGSSGEEPY